MMRRHSRNIRVTLTMLAALTLFYFAESQPAAGQTWIQLAPTGGPPSGRYESTAIYDPATNQMIEGDIAAQTERVMENLKGLLEACGSSLGQVVKTTVFLKDMGEFAKMNEVYARYFSENPPARATVEAARLPRDVRVEIECIAAV